MFRGYQSRSMFSSTSVRKITKVADLPLQKFKLGQSSGQTPSAPSMNIQRQHLGVKRIDFYLWEFFSKEISGSELQIACSAAKDSPQWACVVFECCIWIQEESAYTVLSLRAHGDSTNLLKLTFPCSKTLLHIAGWFAICSAVKPHRPMWHMQWKCIGTYLTFPSMGQNP